MKLLFASIASDGHFNPLTSLAVHLCDLGHDVRWYTGEGYGERLAQLGIPAYPFRRAQANSAERLPELYPHRRKLHGPALIRFDFEQVFLANAEPYFLDVRDIDAEFPFDALICDAAFLGARLTHELLGKYVAAVGVAPSLATAPNLPPNFSGLHPARSGIGRAGQRGLGAAMDRMVLSRGRTQYNSMLARYGLPPVTGSMFDEFAVGVHDVLFQSGVPGFDYPRPPHPEVVHVGALLPHLPDSSAAYPYASPQPGQRVVVVSQGTVDNVDLDKLLIPAVEALAPTGAFVIAATGGRDTAALRQRFGYPNVIVEDWVPFGAVLPHADLLISNGGYGSVLSALDNGVPLVVAGTREGKNDINARVSYTGVGFDLRTETPSVAQIARAANAVLNEPRYRNQARRLQEEIRQYDPMQIIVRHLEHALPDAWLGTAEKGPLEGWVPGSMSDSQGNREPPNGGDVSPGHHLAGGGTAAAPDRPDHEGAAVGLGRPGS